MSGQDSGWRCGKPARLLGAVLATALALAFVAFGDEIEARVGTIPRYVGFGVLWGIAWTLAVGRPRRLDRKQLALFQTALKEGQVPEGADREAWSSVVPEEQRAMARGRRVGRLVVAGIAVCLVAAVVVTIVGAGPEGMLQAAGVFVVFVGPLMIISHHAEVTRRENLETIAEELGLSGAG